MAKFDRHRVAKTNGFSLAYSRLRIHILAFVYLFRSVLHVVGILDRVAGPAS